MARVADYSIVSDAWVLEMNQDTVNFNVPSNIDAGSRSILSFMLNVGHIEDMSLTLRLNGTNVWSWNWSGSNSNRLYHFQEVIAAGVVKPGANVFSFDSSSGDARFVQLSDIVVWWQANI